MPATFVEGELRDTTMRSRSGQGRRDQYRLLARRAARHLDPAKRRLTETQLSAVKVANAAPQASLVLDESKSPFELPLPRAVEGAWTAKIQIRCFGRFEVIRDGVAVERWRRRSAQRVLKFLLVNGRRAHRDVLLDVLWPEVPPHSSVRGLRVTLHALRRAVSSANSDKEPVELVRANEDTYVLNTEGIWVDTDAFAKHYSAGVRLQRQHQLALAMREYAAAAELYRDDFLVEDIYEDWTVLRREELKDQYLLVLTKLSQFCLESSDLDGCIMRSHALLAKEPCREDAYQRLIQCYARLGQRGRAIRWYEICERTLRQELDVAPSDDTRRLYRKITSGTT